MIFTPEMIITMGRLKQKINKDDMDYEKRLKIYANRKKRRENGEIVKPIDNYKIMGFRVK